MEGEQVLQRFVQGRRQEAWDSGVPGNPAWPSLESTSTTPCLDKRGKYVLWKSGEMPRFWNWTLPRIWHQNYFSGEYGPWSDWSECEVDCTDETGKGNRTRSREIRVKGELSEENQWVDCQKSCPLGGYTFQQWTNNTQAFPIHRLLDDISQNDTKIESCQLEHDHVNPTTN